MRAWRYWLVDAAGRLGSVSQRMVRWVPGTDMVARCLGSGHAAPDPGCACGIYGAATFEALRDHGLCVVPSGLAVGEVDLWGRVVVDDDGIRGGFGRPARICLVPETAEASGTNPESVMEGLAAYGVPVGTMALSEAVAGITAAMLANQLMARRGSRGAGPG